MFRAMKRMILIAAVAVGVACDDTIGSGGEQPDYELLLAPAQLNVPQGAAPTVNVTIARTNFTTNHDLIKQEVTRIMGQAEQRETFAQASCRTLYMLGALTGAIDTLARGVGPTTFVVFTSSLVSEPLAPFGR